MKRILLIFAAVILMALSATAQTRPGTLGAEMEFMHGHYGVNFIYDSTISVDVAYSGSSIREAADMDECLKTLFEGSGIEYRVMKKYIVLTKAGAKKKPKDYTIFIEEQYDTINESVVTAMVDPRRNSTQTGLMRIDSSDLNSGFAVFSTPDLIKTLQTLPGVSSGMELLSGFYVHGGDGSDNLFLLDGVPIYQISHLGGLFSSFNTDVVGSLDFYKSGFPARYGSKMSSVVDVATKDGDFNDYHGIFALGLIDGRLQFEGPLWKGKTSFNIGLRRTWTETFTIPLLAVVNSRNHPDHHKVGYLFSDLNAKITHKFSESSRLSANFYAGRDALKYNFNDERQNYYNEDNPVERDILDLSFSWGNILGSLNWIYDFNEALSVKNIAYYSSSYSGLAYSQEEIYRNGNKFKSGQYYTSDVSNLGVKSDWFHNVTPKQRLRYGATLQYHIYYPSATAQTDILLNGAASANVAYADTLKYNTVEAALYAEDEIAVTDAFSVNAGLRYMLYSAAGKTWHSVEPRAALKYSFSDKVSAKASYTEMCQPAHLVSSIYLDLPTNAWLPSTAKIRPSRSREVASGVYSELAHHLHLNIEGWYKHMYNLLEYGGYYSVFPPLTGWENLYRIGEGRSWGAEVDFGFDNGRTEANVYYTLSWSQRKFEDFYRDWYRDRNDNRHKLTVMAKHKFGKRFELYGSWNYHSGNRVTLPSHDIGHDLYIVPNNVKLPDYHRLDLGFNFIKNTRRGNLATWNLSVYNVYNRTNPITAFPGYYSYDGNIVAFYGLGLGIIPIIPTFSYTLKF